jgi:hypothetical protein
VSEAEEEEDVVRLLEEGDEDLPNRDVDKGEDFVIELLQPR